MRHDRRSAPRVDSNLTARWEGVAAQHTATVTSLSVNGCFILTGGTVEPKELVRLEIDLPGGEPIYLWAEVVEAATEIGFSVRFTSTSEEDQARLESFVTSALDNT